MNLLKICAATWLYTILSLPVLASDSDSLNKYYELVHKAHVEICRDDLQESRISFDSAFIYMQVPFMPDISNALYVEVNMPNPDKNRIVHYLRLIQQKGICVHEKYERKEKFKPYLSLVAEEGCKKVANIQAKAIIEKAINEDQKIRNDSYEKYKTSYHPSVVPQIQELDKTNYSIVDSIFRLAQKENIKVEDLIGMESYYDVFVILLHNTQWKYGNTQLIYQLAKSGLIDARYAALQMDDFCVALASNAKEKSDCGPYRRYGTGALRLTMDKAFIMIPPRDIYDEILKNRKDLYLQDLIEESKIKSFAFLNAIAGIYSPGGFDIDASMGEKENAEFESRLKRINTNIIKYNGKEDFDFDRNQ